MHRNFGPNNSIDLVSLCSSYLDKKSNDKILVDSSIFSNADGSSYVEYGETKVVCTVYSPIELRSEEQLTVTVRYAPFSQKLRLNFVNENDTRIAKFLQGSLLSAINFSNHVHSKIEVYLMVLNDDGNAISAMVTCASLALINANVGMYDILIGVSLISHVSNEDNKTKNESISVAVLPNMRQIANIMSTYPCAVSEYEKLMRWDGPLKESLQIYEIVKLHLKKSLNKDK